MITLTTTDTGVTLRRVVAGRYTLHLDEARIGRVFGDFEIGFTAYDNDGATLGRHESLDAAAVVVHTAWTNTVKAEERLQYIEACLRTEILNATPMSA
jgi:hypothetical protein